MPTKASSSDPEVAGEVTGCRIGEGFDVRLDDGRTVTASVSSHTARVMFRIVPGDHVRVAFRKPPKTPRIVGFAKDT
jgi:translation initiation factor IF-1